jgi:hypothetical protein
MKREVEGVMRASDRGTRSKAVNGTVAKLNDELEEREFGNKAAFAQQNPSKNQKCSVLAPAFVPI